MVSLMQIDRLTKSFGDVLLFEDITFGIAQGEKVGLIARNGAGKTTLMRIITGKEDEDSGQIVFRSDLRVGFLEQEPEFTEGHTVLESMDVKPSSEEELKAIQLLTKLKIYDLDQSIETLSGGQQKRAALARVLAHDPELLLLDEPTNHLDLEMVEWLEGYLSRANLSLLMVTHDRYFLDRVCNHIMEIDHGRLYQYKGNYSYYLEKRQERIDAFEADVEKATNLYRKELDWIRRQPQARATKAKYRIDAFDDLEKRAKQRRDNSNVNLNVKASYIGSKIFKAEHVSKRFGDILITDDFDYEFSRYEKMGIIGDNGTGKSTFIKMLLGEVEPDSGHFDVGQTVKFGYYSQEGITLDDSVKVIEAVRTIAEWIDLGDGNKLGVSQFLQHFLFPPEKQHDYIGKLSGGEKRRLNLCMVLMRNPNFLVLDEPTNDLDIMTLNVLEDYLGSFKGCVIVVSHDRYFMDKVVDHLLVFRGNADIKDFPGNYSQYRDYKEVEEEMRKAQDANAKSKQAQKEPSRKPQRTNDKKKLTYKEQKEMEAIEELLPKLEEEKAALEMSMSSGALSTEELLKQSERISQIIDEIDEKTMRWLELSE